MHEFRPDQISIITHMFTTIAAHVTMKRTWQILDITRQYPSSNVTRIDWPSLVCNNNIQAHENTGERSSQYAAENSCGTRFAPYMEWIASFDTDEYLVPMGNYTSIKDVVLDVQKNNTNILSFRSTRAKL